MSIKDFITPFAPLIRFNILEYAPLLVVSIAGIILTFRLIRTDPIEPSLLAQTEVPVSESEEQPTRSAYTLFAPGTPPEVVAEFAKQHPEMMGGKRHGANFFEFDDEDRWIETATDGFGLTQGDPTILTWSIVPDGTFINDQFSLDSSNLIARLDGIYGPGPGGTNLTLRPWFPVFEKVFDSWEKLTGITYVYEQNDDGAAITGFLGFNPGILGVRGDVRISGHFIDGNPSGGSILAYNYFPDVGDMVIDTADNFYTNTSFDSLRLRNILSHEHGHGLGLSHVCPLSETKLMEPIATLALDGPQIDDILAGNRGYGDSFEPNDSIGQAHTLGALSNGTIQVDDIVSIDDNSDIDFFSFSISGLKKLSLTVSPAGETYLSGPQTSACNTGSLFNTTTQNNLAIQILGSNGSTVLGSANNTGLGGEESLSNITLPGAGTYYIRVSGDQNRAQLYTISLSLKPDGPDAEIKKSVSPPYALPGETVTYTIDFTNIGTQDTNDVLITDIMPISITNIISSSTGVPITPISVNPFAWDAGNLGVDEGGTIILTGIISSSVITGTQLFNTAQISTSSDDVDASNDIAGPIKLTADKLPTIYLPIVTKN